MVCTFVIFKTSHSSHPNQTKFYSKTNPKIWGSNLKYFSGMFENTLRIGETQHGLDFFYGRPQDSRKLLEFLQHISPVKYKTSQKLIGHDVNNATYNYKQTYHVELPTVCKDDLICLSKKQAGKGHVIILCCAEIMSNYDKK